MPRCITRSSPDRTINLPDLESADETAASEILTFRILSERPISLAEEGLTYHRHCYRKPCYPLTCLQDTYESQVLLAKWDLHFRRASSGHRQNPLSMNWKEDQMDATQAESGWHGLWDSKEGSKTRAIAPVSVDHGMDARTFTYIRVIGQPRKPLMGNGWTNAIQPAEGSLIFSSNNLSMKNTYAYKLSARGATKDDPVICQNRMVLLMTTR